MGEHWRAGSSRYHLRCWLALDINKNGVTLRQEFALPNPAVAPLRFAGAFVALFAGTGDCAVVNFPLCGAEHKLNVTAVLAGMADDARWCRWRRSSGQHEVRKFLV